MGEKTLRIYQGYSTNCSALTELFCSDMAPRNQFTDGCSAETAERASAARRRQTVEFWSIFGEIRDGFFHIPNLAPLGVKNYVSKTSTFSAQLPYLEIDPTARFLLSSSTYTSQEVTCKVGLRDMFVNLLMAKLTPCMSRRILQTPNARRRGRSLSVCPLPVFFATCGNGTFFIVCSVRKPNLISLNRSSWSFSDSTLLIWSRRSLISESTHSANWFLSVSWTDNSNLSRKHRILHWKHPHRLQNESPSQYENPCSTLA